MMEIFKNTDWLFYSELFVFMLVAFIIGFYFGKKSAIKQKIKTKKETNINDIETIFSEIKPDIIKIIEKHKDTKVDKNSETEVPKNLKINFNKIGYSDSFNKDDLTKIEGLSPFIEEKLNQLGIFSFTQIGKFAKEDIETVTQLIEYFPGRIERDNWVGQANELENKKLPI